MSLNLTYRDLQDIVEGRLERFETLYDDLPKDGSPRDYMEDDGRRYNWFHFRDTRTGKEYEFQYVWHSEFSSTFPECMLSDLPEGINIVSVSEVNPPKPKPVMEEKELSPSQQADKELMARYNEVLPQCVPFTTLRSAKIKSDDLRQIFALLSTKKFSMIDIRSVIIPICIEKRIEMNSFWRFIQRKRRP